MPIEVILRDVQHHGGVGHQAARGFQLEARQFQHPHLRQRVFVQGAHQRGERGRADVAGGQRGQAAGLDQRARQGGDRGLAVSARDGEQAGPVFALLGQLGQRAREQLDFAHDFDAARARLGQQRTGRRLARRQARAYHHLVHIVQQRQFEELVAAQAEFHVRIGQRGAQGLQTARLGTGVRHAQPGALAGEPARGGHARLSQSEDQDERRIGAGGFHRIHRNFRVERPISTSIMVMIQNRTTTWVSFQPPTSKW